MSDKGTEHEEKDGTEEREEIEESNIEGTTDFVLVTTLLTYTLQLLLIFTLSAITRLTAHGPCV